MRREKKGKKRKCKDRVKEEELGAAEGKCEMEDTSGLKNPTQILQGDGKKVGKAENVDDLLKTHFNTSVSTMSAALSLTASII